MDVKMLLIGAALALAPTAAAAQAIVDATDPEIVLRIARGFGEATMGTQFDGSGNPHIEVKASNGLLYYVNFKNCDAEHRNCEDLNFYAGFGIKPTLDQINVWNREWRFNNAYLDSELDAVIESDIDLKYGTTRDSLVAQFEIWMGLVENFADHIGYEP